MKRKSFCFKKMICLLLCVILPAISFEEASSQTKAAQQSSGKKISELEKQKENAKEKAGALKKEADILQGELAELNGQLSDLSGQINDLEEQIREKQMQMEQTAGGLKEAEAIKARQYESMKQRIRYIYENGGIDLISIFLGSNSLAELLNRAAYVEALNRYDRQMLSDYENTCRQISMKEQELKTEEGELSAMQKGVEQKKQDVEVLAAKAQDSLKAKQGEISDAQNAVKDYDAQIAKMKAYEAELERKKAEEAKRRAAEQKAAEQRAAAQKKANENQTPQGSIASGGQMAAPGAGDLAMLAALVECEAGGESYEGKLAVASVVVNRVKSGGFPNTVSGVIYQGGQFSPVASGRFAMVLAKGAAPDCAKAAAAALSGNTNVGSLYFCRADFGVDGIVIGNHVFY